MSTAATPRSSPTRQQPGNLIHQKGAVRGWFNIWKIREQWDQLKDYKGLQYRAELKGEKSYTDEDPEDPDYMPTFRLPPGGLQRLQFQAKRMAENCPGDWTASNQVSLYSTLLEFAEWPNPARVYEVFQTLKFRENAIECADRILATLDIKPALHSTSCLDWNDDHWLNAATHFKRPRKRFDKVLAELESRGCELFPTDEQGPRFHRPLRYIAASLVNARLSKDETSKKIQAITDIITVDRQATAQRLRKQEPVKEIGKIWLALTSGWSKVKGTFRCLLPKQKPQVDVS